MWDDEQRGILARFLASKCPEARAVAKEECVPELELPELQSSLLRAFPASVTAHAARDRHIATHFFATMGPMLGRSMTAWRLPATIARANTSRRRPFRYLPSSYSPVSSHSTSCAASHETTSSRPRPPPNGRNFSTQPARALPPAHDDDDDDDFQLQATGFDRASNSSSIGAKPLDQSGMTTYASSSSSHTTTSPTSSAQAGSAAISPRLQQLRDRLAAEDAADKPLGKPLGKLSGDISSNGPGSDPNSSVQIDLTNAASEKGEEDPSWKQLLESARANQHLLPKNSFSSSPRHMLTDTYSRQHTYLRPSLHESCI